MADFVVEFARQPATFVGLHRVQFLRHGLKSSIGFLQGRIGSPRSRDVDHSPDHSYGHPGLVPYDMGAIQKVPIGAVGQLKAVFGGEGADLCVNGVADQVEHPLPVFRVQAAAPCVDVR